MSIYTAEELQAEIERWKKALSSCATGKSYTIDGRSLTRQDLPEIRKQLAWFERQLARVNGKAVSFSVKPFFRRG